MRVKSFIIPAVLMSYMSVNTHNIVLANEVEGFYMGLSTGWMSVENQPLLSFKGVLASAQVGYNVRLSDYLFAGLDADFTYIGQLKKDARLLWSSTVRGTFGLTIGNFLPYVGLGINYGGTYFLGRDYAGNDYTVSGNSFGWSAGVGAAYNLTENIYVNMEYRYLSYGDTVFKGKNGFSYDARFDRRMMRVGVMYKFQ